jgi:glycosyltransferase involved in cell wall biosynthesis
MNGPGKGKAAAPHELGSRTAATSPGAPSRILRVALDTSFAGLNPTGVGLYSRRLVAGIAALSATRRVEMRCFGPSCLDSSPLRPLGGLYQEWPTYSQVALPAMLAAFRPGVVHSTSHIGPLWGPGRRVVTVHDLIFRRYPDDYNSSWLAITLFLLPRVLARATAIIADSHSTLSDLQNFYGVPARKITVIYPGIDEDYRRPLGKQRIEAARRQLGIGDSPYVLLLGPWVRRKNLGVVVQAFRVLAEQIPGLRLVVTGKPTRGMHAGDLSTAISRLPAGTVQRVMPVGHLPSDTLRAVMQGAAALAYPSEFEGFGLPPLEAMASGVPVVVSDTPAVVEAAGGAALIAPVGDPRAWAEALHVVIADPAMAEALRSAGHERSADFSWARCAGETLDLYDRIAHRK